MVISKRLQKLCPPPLHLNNGVPPPNPKMTAMSRRSCLQRRCDYILPRRNWYIRRRNQHWTRWRTRWPTSWRAWRMVGSGRFLGGAAVAGLVVVGPRKAAIEEIIAIPTRRSGGLPMGWNGVNPLAAGTAVKDVRRGCLTMAKKVPLVMVVKSTTVMPNNFSSSLLSILQVNMSNRVEKNWSEKRERGNKLPSLMRPPPIWRGWKKIANMLPTSMPSWTITTKKRWQMIHTGWINRILRNRSTSARRRDSVPLRASTAATSARPPVRRRKKTGSGTMLRGRTLK
mmetsp:Transcript_41751/g.87608  ORF Transcript_41751/g.87608 Transcript_41751/m.87608 type:complete len:284 (+) Transcript_41751:360-1211(+)